MPSEGGISVGCVLGMATQPSSVWTRLRMGEAQARVLVLFHGIPTDQRRYDRNSATATRAAWHVV